MGEAEPTGGKYFANAAASDYERFVGRYGASLARELIDAADVRAGQRVLDVGCGPGALTRELARVVGAGSVSAIDPSPPFVEACRERNPGADVRLGRAEELPFADGRFDRVLSQLVVNFMTDASAGVAEMRRVTTSGGRIAAAVWDYREGMTMFARFWEAVEATDPNGPEVDERRQMRYITPDELSALWSESGLIDVEVSSATPTAQYEGFDDLWGPFERGIGPSGAYVSARQSSERETLRAEYRRRLGVGDAPFELSARAWLVSGVVA